MREEWTYKKLGEVATFINGYPFKPSDWKDFGRKIIRIQNLNNPNASYNYFDGIVDNKYIVSNGDVLISWSGSLGVFEWSKEEAILNQHIFKVVFNKGDINKRFFEYVVASRINEMKSKVHGITMQHITKRDFDKISIPIPPLAEQERIVAELDLLSSIIEKKKAQLKEYDQLAQSIFYDMFGGILEDTPSHFLKDIASYYIGLTYKPTDVSEQGTIVLRSSNIQNNKLDFNDVVRVNVNINDNKIVHDGDILMCARNGSARLVGKVARIKDISEKMSFGAFMTIIRSEYNDFLFNFFLSDYFRCQLTTSKTATINQITSRMLDNIKTNIPPLSLQQEFADKVESIERQKTLIQQSIDEVQTLFDSRMDYWFD